MSCELTQSVPIGCKGGPGGNKEVLFIEFENVESITAAAGVVTAITVATGKQFRRYQMPRETSFFTEAPNSSVANGTIFYQQELTIVINNMGAVIRNEIMLLAQNRLLAISIDNTGKAWLLGWKNALDVTGGEGGTGTAFGDRNGYVRVFVGQEPEMAPEVQASIIPALLSAAV
jgi:hypothetical protein